MSDINPPTEQSQIVEFAGQLIQQTSIIHLNLEQEFILTTEDKVLLCLTKHLSRMVKRKAWITPLGILLTIIVVFPTTTFQPFIFSAYTWEAMFIICGLISVFWLINALWQSRVSTSINEVVADIKKTALIHEKPQAGIVPASSESEAVGHDDLVIRSATYGANDNTEDVTQILNSNIANGKLEFFISNDNLGGDPIRGVPKKLELEYSYAGKVHKKVVDEGNTITLP